VKYPRLGLCWQPETIGNQSFPGCPEELLDLCFREFLPESGRFLGGEVSSLPIPAYITEQLDMPVVQRVEHLTEDIEERVITGFPCDFRSVDIVLLLPINIPQFEKRIPFMEGLPQLFEILFRIADDHVGVDLAQLR